jgi:hypothetical protein
MPLHILADSSFVCVFGPGVETFTFPNDFGKSGTGDMGGPGSGRVVASTRSASARFGWYVCVQQAHCKALLNRLEWARSGRKRVLEIIAGILVATPSQNRG